MSSSSPIINHTRNLSPIINALERQPFPGFFAATVQGFDDAGVEFEANVPLDGHLDGDLYLSVPQRVAPQSTLFIVLRPLPDINLMESLPQIRVALHGVVDYISAAASGGSNLRITVIDYQSL